MKTSIRTEYFSPFGTVIGSKEVITLCEGIAFTIDKDVFENSVEIHCHTGQGCTPFVVTYPMNKLKGFDDILLAYEFAYEKLMEMCELEPRHYKSPIV